MPFVKLISQAEVETGVENIELGVEE